MLALLSIIALKTFSSVGRILPKERMRLLIGKVAAVDRSTGGETEYQEFSIQRQVYSTANVYRFVNGHKFQ